MASTAKFSAKGRPAPTITRRHRLVDEVYEAVKAMIMSNELQGGEVVSVSAMAEHLGVSRQPVSQAIVSLEQDGFVQSEPFKAPRVSMITTKFIRDVYGVRTALETRAVTDALAHLTKVDRAKLNDDFRALARDGKEPDDESITAFDARLHRLIIERADNKILGGYMANLEHHLTRIRNVYGRHVYVHIELESQYTELGEIVSAILSGDPSRVEQAMRAHMVSHAARLIARVEADNAAGDGAAGSE